MIDDFDESLADYEMQATMRASAKKNRLLVTGEVGETVDLQIRMLEARVSLDQVKVWLRYRAYGKSHGQASAAADIPSEIGWALENDVDMQNEIKKLRKDMQENPHAALQEMVPRALGMLEEKVETNMGAVEIVLKSAAELLRNAGNSSAGNPAKKKGITSNENGGAGTTLSERSSINRTGRRFAGRDRTAEPASLED